MDGGIAHGKNGCGEGFHISYPWDPGGNVDVSHKGVFSDWIPLAEDEPRGGMPCASVIMGRTCDPRHACIFFDVVASADVMYFLWCTRVSVHYGSMAAAALPWSFFAYSAFLVFYRIPTFSHDISLIISHNVDSSRLSPETWSWIGIPSGG